MSHYDCIKKDNEWIFRVNDSKADKVTFRFDFISNEWFKNQHKQFIDDHITLNTLTINTLYRYNYSLNHFYNYLDEDRPDVMKFEDLTYDDIQVFLFKLKYKNIGKSTQALIISSLKRIIQHGIDFHYDGYPTKQIFDGEEYSSIGVEESLKTSYLSDEVMSKIERTLLKEKDIYLKTLLEIIIDTGARISEVLELKASDLEKDFIGKPILTIRSTKNNTERYIPVSIRVKRAMKSLTEYTNEIRRCMNTEKIFVYSGTKGYRTLKQDAARDKFNRFLKKCELTIDKELFSNITFHSFRHTLGTDMLNKGMSIFEIRDYLGHTSLRSTSEYAKVKNPKVQKEYKKLGFIGRIKEEINDNDIESNAVSKESILKSASLPDGACSKPINNEGNICAKFNACIICPKFITTPSHLPVHQNHLERLRKDRVEYMKIEYIGTVDHLDKIESALTTIIDRLEDMENGTTQTNRI